MILVTVWFVRLPMRLLAFPAAVSDVLTPGAFPHPSPRQTMFTAKASLDVFTPWALRDQAQSHIRHIPSLLVHIGAQLPFTSLRSTRSSDDACYLWLRSFHAICHRHLCDLDSRFLAHFALLATCLLEFLHVLTTHDRDSLVDVVG